MPNVKDLRTAASELNKVMELDPPIKTKDLGKEQLEKKILEASKLIEPEDKISKKTQTIISSLQNPSPKSNGGKSSKKAAAKTPAKKAAKKGIIKKISGCRRIRQLLCEDIDRDLDKLEKILRKEGYTLKRVNIDLEKGFVKSVLEILKEQGKIK
jgi:hypothetical protein